MDRMACVDAPALPLQLLLRSHPGWAEQPVAVVDRDLPQGVLQWVNERARARRILPGMRYAAALGLAHDLHAGVVAAPVVEAAVAELVDRLQDFSPAVEASAREPGVFWLDASGLEHLYASLEAWAAALEDALGAAGFRARAVVGFTRFGCYAAARGGARRLVFADAAQERAHLRAVAIDRVGFEPALRDALRKLGITELGAFADLPPAGVKRHFGAATHELQRWVRGEQGAALDPRPARQAVEERRLYDVPEPDRTALLGVLEGFLQTILERLCACRQALAALRIDWVLDDGTAGETRLEPAAPSLDAGQVHALVRLCFESLVFTAGALELGMQAQGVAASTRQLELFRAQPRRELAAANRALAQVRARLGEGAVRGAALQEGHLPEACFAWRPFGRLEAAAAREVALRPLVRRLYAPPRALPGMGGLGPVEEVVGPHVVAGGWWSQEVVRAYHFVRTRDGRWSWIYHDRVRGRWFLHGEVE